MRKMTYLKFSLLIISQLFMVGFAHAQYCASHGGSTYEYITGVEFNTISNTGTGNSLTSTGYSDYTATSTDIDAGSTYNLALTFNTSYTSDNISVWIDWNHDGDFDDTGEDVICSAPAAFGQTAFDQDISVPLTALGGNTTMRISILDMAGACDPCATATYGEIEDYTVNIIAAVPGTSTITTGLGVEPSTISSLTDTQGEAVLNFDFTITDDGSTPLTDTDPFLFSALTINQGAGNDITDWTEAIAGVEISDGTTTLNPSINATELILTGISSTSVGDFGYISDNGTKTYSIKIWLKSTFGGNSASTIDGLNFDFNVDNSSFTLKTGGSGLTSSQSVSSGASNNEVTVIATELQFTTGAPPTAVVTSTNFSVTVSATDANGNTDLGNSNSVTVSLNTGTGTVSSATGLTQNLSSGTYSWTDFQYNTQELFKLQASTVGLTDVISWDINCVSEFTIGSQGTDSDWPFDNYRKNQKTQLIYKSAEMGSQKTLSHIGFNLTEFTPAGFTFTDITIKIIHTSLSAFPNTNWIDMTGGDVFTSTAHALPAATGWYYFTLDTDFPYNGTDNIIVEVNWGSNPTASPSSDNYEASATFYSGEYMCLHEENWANPQSWDATAYNRSTIRTDVGFKYYIPEGETTISAGASSEANTVSSLWDTQPEAVLNFDFTITDDNAIPTTDNDPTKITQIILNQAAGDDFPDWTEAISGAELSDGTSTQTATINSDNLTFTALPSTTPGNFGYIPDNGNKTYSLKIWLKSALGGTLPADIDGKNLVFSVTESSFAVAATGSSLFKSNQAENSGSTNNEVTVVATCLDFTTQPSGYAELTTNLAQPPAISAVDANSNIDLDFVEEITLTSLGGLTLTGNVLNAVTGVIEFTSLQFTQGGGDFGLEANSATLSECAVSTNIIVCGGVYELPFFDNFDDDAENSTPYCWTVQSYSSLGPWQTWSTDPHSGVHSLWTNRSPALANLDEWAYTPPLKMIGGVTYTCKFMVQTGSTFDLDESLEVKFGLTTSPASMTGSIYSNSNITNWANYIEVSQTFTPAVSGDYYVGFHCISAGSRNGVHIDDVWIGEESNYWTGNIDTDWFKTGNWSNAVVPTCISGADGIAVIPTMPDGGVFPHITGIAECEKLTIQTGAYVQIEPNAGLTVCSDITNNNGISGILIIADDTGSGSLIHSTADVPATVESYLEGTRYHYISSPITTAPTSLFVTNQFYYWNAAAEWMGMGSNPPSTIDYIPWINQSSGNLSPAKGYAYYYETSDISYEGNLNVGNFSNTLLKSSNVTGDEVDQGWNFLGNPYPSAIDWDVVTASNYPLSTEVESAVYLFDDADGTGVQANYRYYVPSGGNGGTYGVGTGNATKDIPVGQGFFVRAVQNNINLTFYNSDRIHSTQSFYRVENENPELLRMNISSPTGSDELIVRFLDEASSNFDAQFDARKLFPTNPAIPQCYAISTDGINNAIYSSAKPEGETTIPLGVSCQSGEFNFQVIEQTLLEGRKVYIKDNLRGTETEINTGDSYPFTYAGGIDNNRFELVFKTSTSENKELQKGRFSVHPIPSSGIFFLDFLNLEVTEISISNISGKEIKRIQTQNTSHIQVDLSNYTKGVYFLSVNTTEGVFHKKLITK